MLKSTPLMNDDVIDPLSISENNDVLQYDMTLFNQYLSGPLIRDNTTFCINLSDGLINLANLHDTITHLTDKNQNGENYIEFIPKTKRVYRIPKQNIKLKPGYSMPVLSALEKIQMVQYRAHKTGASINNLNNDDFPFIGKSQLTLRRMCSQLYYDFKEDVAKNINLIIDPENPMSVHSGLQDIIDSFNTMVWSTIGVPEKKDIEKTSAILLLGRNNPTVYPLIGGAMNSYKDTVIPNQTNLNEWFRTVATYTTIKKENDLYRSSAIYRSLKHMFNENGHKYAHTDPKSITRIYQNIMFLLCTLDDIKSKIPSFSVLSEFDSTDLEQVTLSLTTNQYVLLKSLERLDVIKESLLYTIKYKAYDPDVQLNRLISKEMIESVFTESEFLNISVRFTGCDETKAESDLEIILKPIINLLDFYDLWLVLDLEIYAKKLYDAKIVTIKDKFLISDTLGPSQEFITDVVSTTLERYDALKASCEIDSPSIKLGNVNRNPHFFDFPGTIDLEDMLRINPEFLQTIKPMICSNILDVEHTDYPLEQIPDTKYGCADIDDLTDPIVVTQNDVTFKILCVDKHLVELNIQDTGCASRNPNHLRIKAWKYKNNFFFDDAIRARGLNTMTNNSYFFGIPVLRTIEHSDPTDHTTYDPSSILRTNLVYLLHKKDNKLCGELCIMTDSKCCFYDTMFQSVSEFRLREIIMNDELKYRAQIHTAIRCITDNDSVYRKIDATMIRKQYDVSWLCTTHMINNSNFLQKQMMIDGLVMINTKKSLLSVPVVCRYSVLPNDDMKPQLVPMNVIVDGTLMNTYTSSPKLINNDQTQARHIVMVRFAKSDNILEHTLSLDPVCFYDVECEQIDNPVLLTKNSDETLSLEIKIDKKKKYGLIFVYDDPSSGVAKILNTVSSDGLMMIDKDHITSGSRVYVKLDTTNLPVCYKNPKTINLQLYTITKGVIKQDAGKDNNSQSLKNRIVESGYIGTLPYDQPTDFGWKVLWILKKAHADSRLYFAHYFNSLRINDFTKCTRYFDHRFDIEYKNGNKVLIPVMRETLPYKLKCVNSNISTLISASPLIKTKIHTVLSFISNWILLPSVAVWYYGSYTVRYLLGVLGLLFIPVILFLINVVTTCINPLIINKLIIDTSAQSIRSAIKPWTPFDKIIVSPLLCAIFTHFSRGFIKIVTGLYMFCKGMIICSGKWLCRYMFEFLPAHMYAKFINYYVCTHTEGNQCAKDYMHDDDYYLAIRTDNDTRYQFVDRHMIRSSITSNGSDYVMDIENIIVTNIMKHVYASCIDELCDALTPGFNLIASDTSVSAHLNDAVSNLHTQMIVNTQALKSKTTNQNVHMLLDQISNDIHKDQQCKPMRHLKIDPRITRTVADFVSPSTIKTLILKSDQYSYDLKHYANVISICKMIVLPTQNDVLRLLNNCEKYVYAVTGIRGGNILQFLDQNLCTLKSRQFMECILFYVQTSVSHMSPDTYSSTQNLLNLFNISLGQISGLDAMIDPGNTRLRTIKLSSVFSNKQNMIALCTLARHNIFTPDKFPYSIKYSDLPQVIPPPPVILYSDYSVRLHNLIVRDTVNLNFYNTVRSTINQYISGVKSHPHIKTSDIVLRSYFSNIETDPSTDNNRRSAIGYILRHMFKISSPLSDSFVPKKNDGKKNRPVQHSDCEEIPDPTSICRLLISSESLHVSRKTPIGFVRAVADNLINTTKNDNNIIYTSLVDETELNTMTGFTVGEELMNAIKADIK